MNAWLKRNEASHENSVGQSEAPSVVPKSLSLPGASLDLSSSVASRLDVRLKMVSTLLYVMSALAMLLFVHGGWFEFTREEVGGLDRVLLAGGVLVGSVWFFPWGRFERNVLLVPASAAIGLITLAVYFSGGWQSPLSIFYLFVVAFCAIYFSSGIAALCVAATLLASLSPQLYAPDQVGLVEYLTVQAPVYAGLVLACRYALWERTSLQQERDSERIKDLEERLWHEASLDPLTGLYNRGRFEIRFEEEFERTRHTDEQFMVLFVDVDDFKNVNDNNGHRTGDEALKLVADVLRSCSRGSVDVVARHGGDEFLVLLPGTSLPDAHRFFGRMRDSVAESSRRTLGLDLRLSAGAVQCPGYSTDPAALLDAADQAMYRAKRLGKNRMFAALSLAPAEHRRASSTEE
jgi:diguanylate cyclase (GGDEF)-like protein